MVLPLLGTRRPDSLPEEAPDGSDDMAITGRNSGALPSGRCKNKALGEEGKMRRRCWF